MLINQVHLRALHMAGANKGRRKAGKSLPAGLGMQGTREVTRFAAPTWDHDANATGGWEAGAWLKRRLRMFAAAAMTAAGGAPGGTGACRGSGGMAWPGFRKQQVASKAMVRAA